MTILPRWYSWAKWGAIGIVIITIGIVIIILIGRLSYNINWPAWTGFNTYTTEQQSFESTVTPLGAPGTTVTITRQTVHYKTLWDWLQLLIVPLMVAVVGFLLNRAQSARTEQFARESQREAALQAYLDRMKDLLLVNRLRTSQPTDEVRAVALVVHHRGFDE